MAIQGTENQVDHLMAQARSAQAEFEAGGSQSPDQGADTIVWLAAAAEAGRASGLFWLDRRPHTTHVFSRTRETPEERRQLWEELCRLTGYQDHDE